MMLLGNMLQHKEAPQVSKVIDNGYDDDGDGDDNAVGQHATTP